MRGLRQTASPPISTTPGGTAVIGSGAKLADSATLSGGYNPTGTITFTLYSPAGAVVDTETVSASGNGTYVTPLGYLPAATGTYQWVASYAGDANNIPAAGAVGDEPEAVSRSRPAMATTSGGTVVVGTGAKLTASTTRSGGYNASGTITFILYSPGNAVVDTETVSVSGNGTYTPPSGYLPTAAGIYQWVASYSGDRNDRSVASNLGDAPETAVTSTTSVEPGEFATIGFWQNQNGQAVIKSFNGSSSATALGNWLATNFAHLFGASNPYTGTSLAGLTNAQVAAVYANLGTPNGVPRNTFAQAFSVALGVYAGSAGLGFDTTAQQYGFKAVSGGGGSLVWTVGSSSAAFSNQAGALTVFQILQTVDANFAPSTGLFYGGSQALTSAANNVLNGINTTGDV